ncbi:uncharacterized protein G6M90_00g027320 [Metarhizium brunneum]|uniref:Uncharacterized protein n=1 Tax=Metarhizium brunneum TaxID=500148 RepID=A0A7D5UPT8_9HYPO
MNIPSGNGVEGNPLTTDARPDGFHPSISGLEPNSWLDYNGQAGGCREELDFNQYSFDLFCSDQIEQAEQGQMTPLTAFLMSDSDQYNSTNDTPEAVIDDSFLSTPASQPQVASSDIGTPCLSPSRPGHSTKGAKWTEEMNAFLVERKNMGEKYDAIAERMQEKFGVHINSNILTKRYKKIAEQESKEAILYKAIVNATPRIKSVLEDELDKMCAGDACKLVKEKQDMNRQLPDLLQSLRAALWKQAQAQARGA